MIDYYIIMIHCWIPPLQTEEKQSERTDIDGQSQILGSHRPRKQRQWWGWRVLMLQQWWNDAWLIGRKVKGHRKRASGTWCCVFIHVYMYVPGQNPFLFHAFSIENVCPSNMESQWLTFFGHWILQNCWRSNVF